MAMTFSKMVSASMQKFKDESDLDRKVLAAEELLDNAKAMGAHTARFIRIAWIFQMLFFFLAALVFNVAICFEFIGDVYPPALRQILEPIVQSEEFTTEIKQWLFCIAVLLALPIVFSIILSVVCKSASVPEEETADEAKVQAPKNGAESITEKLKRIEDMLRDVRSQMDPLYLMELFDPLDAPDVIPLMASIALCILFMSPLGVVVFVDAQGDMNEIIGGIVAVLVLLVILLLICWVELCAMKLFFSSWKTIRQAKKLRNEFDRHRSEYEAQYKEDERKREEEERQRREAEQERKRLADLKEGAELYKRATMGEVIDERLMAQAAEKGDPQAGLYVGKQMIQDMKGLTTKEIVALCNKAKKYFKAASDANIPDGIFLYAYIQSMTESHNEDDWTAILRRVRALRKEDLSENLRGLYDMTIEQLVDVTNSAAESAAARRREYQAQKARQEAEDRALWEEILRRPCKYSNGHYCTLKSTASSLYPCTGDGKGRNFCVDYAK